MKFFRILVIFAASASGVATAKDYSRSHAKTSSLGRTKKRDHKRYLRLKNAGRQLEQPACVKWVDTIDEADECCISSRGGPGGKSGKSGTSVSLLLAGEPETPGGCAKICRPFCAEGSSVPFQGLPDTCIEPQDKNPKVPLWASTGACKDD